MKKRLLLAALLPVFAAIPAAGIMATLEDLSPGGSYEPGREYRLANTGLVATVEADHLRVTAVQPGSPVDGQLMPGDRVVALQGRRLSGDYANAIRVAMLRLWRENDGRLSLRIERPAADDAAGERFTLRLHLGPPPGTVQHFGPTGMYAAIHEGHLVVDRVKEGSPADGRLQPGDRVRAIEGRALSGDLYALFAECIARAETPEREGRLALTIERPAPDGAEAGGPTEVVLTLPVIGTRSETSPRACPTNDVLIARAADALMTSGNMGRLNIGLLGLLATGEEDRIAYVGRRLREADFTRPDVELSLATPMTSWPWSYRLIALCEYYLLTGDDAVLPAIENHAVTIAKGQDVAGLWNHRMADPAANFGQLHGRLYGYGAINQTAAVLWIGLILAEQCGIEHPEVRAAIERTRAHYGNWAGKGALPYGNHAPMEHLLTNNGTSGSVAVGFALLGDEAEAGFYASLSAASQDDIFTGHTGPFFNYLWTGLGANVLGPEVWAGFERDLHWLRTLMRTWDGAFQYMEARGSVFDYSGLSATGAHLLNLSVGRRALRITGRGMDRSHWLEGPAAAAALRRPRPDAAMTPEALLDLLGSPLPPVRLEAARALAEQEAEVDAALLDLLRTGTRDQRIGALHAVGALGLGAAVEDLLTLLKDAREDLWLRELAARTLGELDEAQPHAMPLLALIAADKPEDTFGDLDRTLGTTVVRLLSPDPYAHDLDRDVFYAAALKLLDHPHFWGRQQGMNLLRNVPLEDFHRVADRMIYVIEDRDRTYTAYHGDGHRQAGLEILLRLGIREAIDLTVDTIRAPTGRGGARTRNRVRLLETFGGEARHAIPRIREVLGDRAETIVARIEADEAGREMITLEEAKQAGASRE